MRKNFIIIILLLFFIFYCLTEECPKDAPIKYNDGECQLLYCTEEEFEKKICKISNEITKTQWLNNMLIYDKKLDNENLGVTIHNNQLFFSFYNYNNDNTNSIFLYSINNDNNELLSYKAFNSTNELECNYDNELLSIKIKNLTDEYFLFCCSKYCKLINYSKDKVIDFQPHNFSNYRYLDSFSHSLFQLNDNNNYFYGVICGSQSTKRFLSISKFNFSYNELNDSIDINYANKMFEQELALSLMLSCFQTEKNIIECMIVDKSNKLYIFIIDEISLEINQIFIDNLQKFHMVKSIHFEKEIGIYNYFNNSTDLYPTLLIKNITFDQNENKYQLIDILKNSIRLNLNYNNEYEDAPVDMEMIKISEESFSILYNFYSLSQSSFLFLLFDLYGKNNKYENIIVRYYKIPKELYNIRYIACLKGFLYEKFLGFSMISEDFPLFLIFGRNNNIEPNKIVNINNINNETLNYKIKINDYIYNNIKIDNNIFGYEFIGFQIIKLIGISDGVKYYLNSYSGSEIKENDILNINDEIIIDYSSAKAKVNNDFYLELSTIFGEPEYDKFNKYTDNIEIFGEEDQKNYFNKKIFQGNSIKFMYNFGCHKMCDTCEYAGLKLDEQKCTTCKKSEDYCYMKDENNCFDVKVSTFKYFNKIGELVCVPLNENCPDDFPFENKITKECEKSISFLNLTSNDFEITTSKPVIDKIIELLNDQIKNKTINITEDTIINGKNITFHLTSPEKQKEYIDNDLYNNISSIDLNKCENILKQHYKINNSLIIMKIDIKRNDTFSTQVEYEIFNPHNGEPLNLSICENETINVYVPIDMESSTFDLLKQIKEQGYDILDPNDSFYNDICTPYNSVNNTDVIISDRKKDFYNPNFTLCEENCKYKSFNINTSKANCECQTKTEIKTDISETKFSPNLLIENFFSFDKYTNYKVLKCYNLAFNLKKLKKNIGSYIIIFILICFIIVLSFNFNTQINNYEELFNKIIDSNFKIENKIKKSKKDEKEKDGLNKKICITEPNDNDKNIKNRMRLSSVNISEISIISGSTNKNDENINQNEIANPRFSQNKNIEGSIFDKISFSTLSLEEDSINSIKAMCSIKSPKKMNNMLTKINNLETLPESIIESKKIPKNKNKKNDNNFKEIIKDCTKDKDNNSITSLKNSIINHLDYDKKPKWKNPKKNRRLSRSMKFPIKLINSNKKLIENSNEINIENTTIPERENKKEKKFKRKLTRSKTIKINNSKIIENEEKMDHILKKIPKKERSNYFNENELNDLEFKYAVNIDFRSFFQFYWSLINQTHPIFFTFISKKDYNLFYLKVGLFTLSFALNITMNALFFSDDSMHKLYEDYGKFDFVYNLPQTIYSALISGFLSFLFEKLALSEDAILNFKENNFDDEIYIKKKNEIKCLVNKSIIFFIFGITILLFFWYYLSCFCAVYYNTQVPLIKDTFISFALGLLYPIPLTLIPTLIRIPSLRIKSNCLFRTSRIVTFVLSLI